MGCTQSKIENEEAVLRCRDRKQFMKEAVLARNAFAAAHSAYAMALKNTGAALSDYAHGEFQSPNPSAVVPASAASSSGAATASTVIPPPIPDTLRPPPPPFATNYPSSPLQRAASMPEIKIPPNSAAAGAGTSTIYEEEEEELDEDDGIELEKREGLIRKTRSRSTGGSNRGRREEHDGAQPPPPPVVAESSTVRPSVPTVGAVSSTMPPAQQHGYFDYFFPQVEHMPGTTLEDTPPSPPPLQRQPVVEPEELVEPMSFEEKPLKVDEFTPSIEKTAIELDQVAAAVGMGGGGGGGGGGSGRGSKKGKGVGMATEKRVVNLLQMFAELDDHFLKASESAHEVSKMLEATRLHYHSNFADNRGHIDHSARVMRAITWNRSFRGMPNVDDGKDDFDSEDNETHATVLDKLLAWEKKLYDEVRAGENMKFEYQKKIATLNKLKKRSANSDKLERAKATVSHLHTRYIVDMQSMDSTVLEINRLRDEQLYPKLVQLVEGMSTMWKTMRLHHESQSRIVTALRAVDISQSVKDTSEHHHERTIQLLAVVQEWHAQFAKLIDYQKDYTKSLNSWLKLNLVPIESSLKEKVSSPPRVQTPPIQRLLFAWHDHLDRLCDEVARTAIINFAAIISTIMHQQDEEMKLRDKCEESRKELLKKTRAFEDWYQKYMQRNMPDEMDPDRTEDSTHKDAVTDRQFIVDQVKQRLEEEVEMYQKQSLHVREKSLASLKTHLPELFKAMTDVARGCSDINVVRT